MEENKVVNYFFVAGLPERVIEQEPLDSPTLPKLPIIDIVLINKSQGETPPKGYEYLEFTPTRYPANLNHGSLRTPEIYICFKRGRNTPPIVDIGIIYHSENVQIKPTCQVITKTPYGRSANVSNISGEKIYLSFCKAEDFVEWDTLAVSDICVLLPGKGETVPYAFHKIEKNLNLGMLGSDVFLCYRKSFIKNKCLTYNAELLFRYPKEDHPSLALPTQLPMFCLPLGATVERWCANSRHPLPVFSTFVLTDQVGQKCYGASVVFYKDFDSEFLTREQEEFFNEEPELNGVQICETSENESNGKEKYVYQQNQSICLISKWPFFEAFKKFLLYLYRISVSGPQAIPIERYISQFFNEIPFPSPERPYISIQLTNEEIVLVQPDETPLPKSGASFSKFLLNLGPDICISILVCVLLEHKIVIHSIRPDLLTCVAETVSMIIFPFTWQCPYVPLCPLQLSEIVYSPTPFIIGLDSCYFDAPDPPPPSDITYVDLDAQSIKLSSERSGDTTKILPKKAFKTLKHSLEEFYDNLVNDPSCPGTPGDLDCHGSFSIRDALNQQKQRKMDVQIQECFLRFMAYLLKGYRSYLLPVSEATMNGEFDLSKLFDVPAFLKSHDKSYQRFLSEMLRTQYFCHFLEGRSLGTKDDAGLSFFDDCLQKLSSNSSEPLVEVEEKLLSEMTAVISLNDNLKEIPDVTYNYNGFTHLRSDLFESTIHNVKSSKFLGLPTRDLHKGPFIALRRNKQETKASLAMSSAAKSNPEGTARCLLWSCYSMWFILLPSQIEKSPAKSLLMRLACRAMMDLLSRGGMTLDEVPFRIFFQLCGIYNKPQMAIKVFKEMKKHNITLNVTTYGYYNSAVFDKKFMPEGKGFNLWRKLSVVIIGIRKFKIALLRSSMASRDDNKGSQDSVGLKNDAFNIFSKSPNNLGRNNFMRMSLRNTIFKKSKPKTYTLEAGIGKGSRTSFSPGEAIRSFFLADSKKTSSTQVANSKEKFNSYEELKTQEEESSSDGKSSSGAPYTPERRNHSQASTPLPQSPSFFKNDSLLSFIQTAKQNVQNKLISPSRNSLNIQGKPLEGECSNISCLAMDSNLSTYSLSENVDQSLDAAVVTSDASSISSSVSSVPLHKRHRDEFFACQYPHLFVQMSTQTKCSNCSSLLYEEQIMSSWNLGDSDLNTKCYCCSTNFVPMLHINIKEHSIPAAGSDGCEDEHLPRFGGLTSEFEVQYLSPLVVRKELENMLYQKGDHYINEADLIGEHSITFWNLLWHISKLGLPTHLKQMLLQLKKCNLVKQVVVKSLWDSPHTHHDFGPPMYLLWKEIESSDIFREEPGIVFSKSLLQQLISGVISTRIPLDLVIQERSKSCGKSPHVLLRDLFHDILFLSMTALDRRTFDIDKFESHYEMACENLPIRERRKLMAADEPPSEEASWCRRVFRQLHLS